MFPNQIQCFKPSFFVFCLDFPGEVILGESQLVYQNASYGIESVHKSKLIQQFLEKPSVYLMMIMMKQNGHVA